MIAISGGGTGGHLAIARAFCAQLNELGKANLFIGSTNGQDKMWFENDENFATRYFLPSSGVVNKRGFGKFKSLFNIIRLAFECRKIFHQNNVKAVICVGGYSAAPAAFGALLCGLPLFIHEQNAITGKLNSLLRKFAKGFYSSYEAPFYTYPVNAKFFECARKRSELKTLLFLGGSQGAKAINNLAITLAPKLREKGIKIIHQCGKNSLEGLREQYAKMGFNEQSLELFDFCKDIEQKISKADLCISRAGASSLWEITANGLPTIFVPFPHAASNHQFYNAKFLLDQNLTKVCLQDGDNLDENKILNLIQTYNINNTSKALLELINNKNTSEIIKDILAKI